jgi:hypothetical protein
MSGGEFNYTEDHILDIAERINAMIEGKIDHGETYSPAVLERFQKAEKILRIAYAYAHRIDWLVSGDDGPTDFLDLLDSDIDKLEDSH